MIKIQLTNTYQIQRDRYSWAIAKRTKRNGVRNSFEAFSWFPLLSQAIREALELELSDQGVKDVQQVDQALAEISESFAAQLKHLTTKSQQEKHDEKE